ncbi:hypothetical protein [Terasakiella sp. SH-1]|uniref:hypothetical protein n=1 Tax=Terasakiella sp. SH-1 TaxID=2560057 RepID=UPI001074677B|nr:hypothetical protein [Terasakiella sp. SH-1]
MISVILYIFLSISASTITFLISFSIIDTYSVHIFHATGVALDKNPFYQLILSFIATFLVFIFTTSCFLIYTGKSLQSNINILKKLFSKEKLKEVIHDIDELKEIKRIANDNNSKLEKINITTSSLNESSEKIKNSDRIIHAFDGNERNIKNYVISVNKIESPENTKPIPSQDIRKWNHTYSFMMYNSFQDLLFTPNYLDHFISLRDSTSCQTRIIVVDDEIRHQIALTSFMKISVSFGIRNFLISSSRFQQIKEAILEADNKNFTEVLKIAETFGEVNVSCDDINSYVEGSPIYIRYSKGEDGYRTIPEQPYANRDLSNAVNQLTPEEQDLVKDVLDFIHLLTTVLDPIDQKKQISAITDESIMKDLRSGYNDSLIPRLIHLLQGGNECAI